MANPFEILWSDGSGNPITNAWFPVGFPGTSSEAKGIQMTTNAISLQTFESLQDVQLFLTGDADSLEIVQNQWPVISSTNTGLNGGYDISFDNGQTYTRFTPTAGLVSNPSTWITVPATAIGSGAIDGQLSAFDTAHFLLRVVVPPSATNFQVFNVVLSANFNIL